MNLDLIGITGTAGSGKDTIGQFLCDRYGFTRVAFADPLKAMAKTIGWDGSKADGGPCEHCGMLNGRKLLQVLGTEGVRDILGEDTWVQAALRAITEQRLATGQQRWVITDVRYPNEAAMIRAHGGEVWRVTRPAAARHDSHPSETVLQQIAGDTLFINIGNVADLFAEVEDYAERSGWHEAALVRR